MTTTLGIVHRTLHAPKAGQAAGMAAASADSLAERPATRADHSLLGDHSGNECRLYDQLCGGAAAPGVPLVILPLVLPAATFAWREGEALARWVALFDARGPPLTR